MKFHGQTASSHTVLLATVLLAGGCTMADYKMTKGAVQPPQLLHLIATQPPIEAVVHAVIVEKGPGAWKQEAWWDEYVVTIANHGDAPLRVDSATLLDFEGQASTAGVDPWKLERLSKKWWQTNSARNVGHAFALGVGAYGVVGVAFYSGIAATSSLTGGAAAATGVATAFVVAVPVVVVGTLVINNNHKHKIETEFSRRRLALPATIAPGGVVQGSLFFRLSPGPQRLVLHYRTDGQPRGLAIELKPLAALHFKKRVYSTPPAPAAVRPVSSPDARGK